MSPGLADVARGVVLGGRYRIDDVLGHGGMATVYRAHDEVLGRDVAVKLFPPTDGDEVQRHQAEMRVLARLSHPNLVTLHDAGSAFAGRSSRQTYLVMELVPGPTLADLLATGRLTGVQAARVGRQLAQALATVHDAGVVHRDIKPANVLLLQREHARPDEHPDALTTGPLVKIADFGIARLAGEARLTMTGTTMGTATYLSPEQASGGDVGPETDVYALGLVLLECLTGRKAFTGTVMEVAAARLTTDPVIPTTLGPAWCELLVAMTARDPAGRPSMTDVAARLDALELGGEAGGDLGDTGPVAAPVEVVTAAHAARPHGDPARTAPAADDAPDDAAGGVRAAADVPTAPGAVVEAPDGPTRRMRTAHILAAAGMRVGEVRPRTGAASGQGTPYADDEGPGAWWSAGSRLTVVLALTTAVLLAALGALLTRPSDDVAPPPTYPAVDGRLGDALDDLAESVVP